MLFIYDYFMHNRLYCDILFYRVTQIKAFIEIRKYKTSPQVPQGTRECRAKNIFKLYDKLNKI